MTETLITGTVRGKTGNRYTLVTPRGETLTLVLDGLDTPKIGVDVVGVIDRSQPELRMRLIEDVTRKLLSGKSRIVLSGRSDVTARILARILAGAGPASIRPGTGGMIERTPSFDDPDVKWALDILGPEAARAGVALNVIDPIALASSEWSDQTLKDEILPADATGETTALVDLRRLLNDGMTPTCRRTLTSIGRGLLVPSVDFVLPYSPFATGTSWAADIARASRNEIVGIQVSGSDARRLSTFREVALAFAPRYLGKIRSDEGYSEQLDAAFADTAAALAMLRTGNKLAALRFQRLREAAVARWDGTGSPPLATGVSLAAAIGMGQMIAGDSTEGLLQAAAQIAQAHAPTTKTKYDLQRQAARQSGVFIDLEKAPREVVEMVRRVYRADLAETLSRLTNEQSIERMSRFGLYSIPIGLEDVFDDLVQTPNIDQTTEGIAFPADPWVDAPEMVSSPSLK